MQLPNFLAVVVGAALIGGLSSDSRAALIYDATAPENFVFAIGTPPDPPLDFLNGIPFLYRVTAGGTETGAADLFDTTFDTATSLTITLDPGQPKPSLLILTVQIDGLYGIWELNGWDDQPYTGLVAENNLLIAPGGTGTPSPIQAINLYGVRGTGSVPESGTTLGLLGVGLLALSAGSRMVRRS
jgi:hypothetical protein